MVRRTTHAYDTTIAAACPKCRVGLRLLRSSIPQIDSCGFESYSFQCESCKSSLAGIIDPMDEELLVSLLEPTSSCEQSSREKSGFPDEAPYRLRRESRSDDSGIETTGLSRLPISLLGLKTGTLFSGTSTLTPLFGFRPMRPALSFTENAPKPHSSTRSFLAIAVTIS
jgi:hypothetical protein